MESLFSLAPNEYVSIHRKLFNGLFRQKENVRF
mgnify:CR=1 FL=1